MIIRGPKNSEGAVVNAKGELATFSVSETEAQAALEAGLAYNLNTKDITSLTAGDATLIYLKNEEDQPIIIEQMIIGIRGFTGLSDMAQWTTINNPTGGDLITDATTAPIQQNRKSRGKALSSDTLVYKGKAGGTVTGGDEELYGYIPNNTRLPIPIGVEIDSGDSFAVKIESDATAGTAYCAIVCHVKDAKRSDTVL